jgi:hypothetical protein
VRLLKKSDIPSPETGELKRDYVWWLRRTVVHPKELSPDPVSLRMRESRFPKTCAVTVDVVFDGACKKGRDPAPRTIISTGMLSGLKHESSLLRLLAAERCH